jgi:integrase
MPDRKPSRDGRKLEKTKTPGIYKRGDTYVVRWRHRGKPKKRFFPTYALAREFKGKIDGGERHAPTRMTVAEYYEKWIVAYRGRTSRGLDESTRDDYRRQFTLHILPHLGRRKLRELDSLDVSDWFGDLERDGVKPPTIRKAKAALSAMTATATQDRVIALNPVHGVRYVPAVAVEKPKRRTLTVADVDAILAALEPQWRLFFEVLAHSGMRVSELLGLTWQHVYTWGDQPHLNVVEQFCRGKRKRLKTDGSERRIPLSAGMAKALTDWHGETRYAGAEHPVFASTVGTPLGYGNVYNRVLQPALKACGLDGQGVGFHAFRKLAGSILLQRAGKNPKQVQQWLGHSQLTTTMNVYVHELDDGLGGADDLDTIYGSHG